LQGGRGYDYENSFGDSRCRRFRLSMKAWGTAPAWCRPGTAERRLSTPTARPVCYLQAAEQRRWRIEAVFETHVHADFVTGALELTAVCGSRLFASAEAGPAYG